VIRTEYSITAQFDEGDPAYEWMILFLVRIPFLFNLQSQFLTPLQTQEKVWRRARDFRVNAKNSKRKWGVSMKLKITNDDDDDDNNADYVPTYEMPQIFHWNGYWLEIKRSKGIQMMTHHGAQAAATIYVT
jgi:chaperone BCS1